jgi:hypothetical protein
VSMCSSTRKSKRYSTMTNAVEGGG